MWWVTFRMEELSKFRRAFSAWLRTKSWGCIVFIRRTWRWKVLANCLRPETWLEDALYAIHVRDSAPKTDWSPFTGLVGDCQHEPSEVHNYLIRKPVERRTNEVWKTMNKKRWYNCSLYCRLFSSRNMSGIYAWFGTSPMEYHLS